MSNGPLKLSRRTVLKAIPVTAGGLALGLFDVAEAAEKIALPQGAGLSPNVFVHVAPSGEVSIVCHRSEMGQGIRSTLPVLIADELGADMAKVRIVQGDGDPAYGDQNTDGSSSIRTIYEKMRGMGATTRTMLIAAAAQRWKVKPEACEARDHRVFHPKSGRSLGFGELAVDAAKLPIPKPETVRLRPEKELTRVFRPMPLLDGPDYVTGRAVFGADVKLPGMLTAVIARPPVVGGKVKSFDATAALKVPGVRKVIKLPEPKRPWAFQPLGGVAVVADHTWAAIRGREALQITWDHGENAIYDSQTFREALTASLQKPGTVHRKRGDVEAALAKAKKVHEATYHVPHLPHAPMEPPVAVARVEGGTCEVWAPTQNPQAVQKEVGRALGIPPEKVIAHVTLLGGGFGRKSKPDYCSEAALLARELGVPVRVQWTREDDFRHDYLNTVASTLLTAGLDEKGKVVAWRHRSAFPPIATLFGGGTVPDARALQQGVLDFPLSVPNVQAEGCEAKDHTRIGWLRAVNNIFQAFSIGSFIDELAALRGTDPRDTWFELLGPARKASLEELGIEALPNYGQPLAQHPVDVGRLRGVIDRVTRMARWEQRKKDGRALGLAAHRSFLSYAAAVASVVKKPNGKLAVDEVWVAFDAGTVVNPDRVRAQLEGSVIFGMSLALYGGITFKNGAIEQSNFRKGGRMVRINEAPRTHVELVESSAPPGGVGEPGVPPIAPAIANAVFALTGTRARELPLIRTVKV